MNESHLNAAFSDVAGRVEGAAGAIVDDPGAELKGKARQAAGKLEGAYAAAVDAVSNTRQSMGRAVQGNPMVAILIAGAVGYILGWAIHRG